MSARKNLGCMLICSNCGAAVDLPFEQLVRVTFCPTCGAGPKRVSRGTVWLFLFGCAAYLPVMGCVFVEIFDVEPEVLIVSRHDHSDATAATMVFFVGAIAWLMLWWRMWRRWLARLVASY